MNFGSIAGSSLDLEFFSYLPSTSFPEKFRQSTRARGANENKLKVKKRCISTSFLLVEGGVIAVEVFGIQLILRDSQGFRKALIVDDLAGTKKFDGIAHVGVINKAQNVIVGCSCLLLCCYRSRATK